jgi:hypothetical protein
MAASSSVLNTYELLENILLHLPLRQLLLAQRVNKKFHAVIEDSLKINQALFFKPSSNHHADWEDDIELERETGPLSPSTIQQSHWKQIGGHQVPVILLNPFTQLCVEYLPVRWPPITRLTRDRLSGCPHCADEVHMPHGEVDFDLGRKRFRGCGGTWCLDVVAGKVYCTCREFNRCHADMSIDHMLLSDPPIRGLKISWSDSFYDSRVGRSFTGQ